MSVPSAVLLLSHLLATTAMVGLIWFVQVVHYPLFAAVGAEEFVDYERAHQRLTSYVVGPFMAVEGVTALWLAFDPPHGTSRLWPFVGLIVLGIVHTSTVFLQVPQHTALSGGYDPLRVSRLVRTNWVRTIGWTVRALIVAAMAVDLLVS